jgi:hypothetical protein
LFDVKDKQGQTSNKPQTDLDDEIPFTWVLPLMLAVSVLSGIA